MTSMALAIAILPAECLIWGWRIRNAAIGPLERQASNRMLRAGYGYVPYRSLESVIEHNKDAYYLALRRTQGQIRSDKPNWQP